MLATDTSNIELVVTWKSTLQVVRAQVALTCFMVDLLHRVHHSFLSAAKHGRAQHSMAQQSLPRLKGSPGHSLGYSASSEDAASTSGPGQADEASSVEVI